MKIFMHDIRPPKETDTQQPSACRRLGLYGGGGAIGGGASGGQAGARAFAKGRVWAAELPSFGSTCCDVSFHCQGLGGWGVGTG